MRNMFVACLLSCFVMLNGCASQPDFYGDLDLRYPSDVFVRASVRAISSMMDALSLELIGSRADESGTSASFTGESAKLAQMETGGGSILLSVAEWTHDSALNWVEFEVSNFHRAPDQPPYTSVLIAIEDGRCRPTDQMYNERSLCSALSAAEWKIFALKAIAFARTTAGFQ